MEKATRLKTSNVFKYLGIHGTESLVVIDLLPTSYDGTLVPFDSMFPCADVGMSSIPEPRFFTANPDPGNRVLIMRCSSQSEVLTIACPVWRKYGQLLG